MRHRHLHGDDPTRTQRIGQPSEQPFVVRQPVQRRVGEDQIGGGLRGPGGDVAPPPVEVGLPRPRLLQHGRAGIQPVHPGPGPAPLQLDRVLTRSAPEVPDPGGVQIAGQARQQIVGGAVALAFEPAVLKGVPGRRRVGHAVTRS